MNKSKKKLALNKETIRDLNRDKLRRVAGGGGLGFLSLWGCKHRTDKDWYTCDAEDDDCDPGEPNGSDICIYVR